MLPDPYPTLSAFPLPCLLLDQQARVLFANMSSEDILQRSNRTLTGMELEKLFPSAHILKTLFEAAQDQSTAIRAPEIEIDNLHNYSILVSAHISPYPGKEWLLVLVPINQDSTSGGNASLKSRAGSLSAMAGMLAHEIKNPLAAIRGAAQLMSDHNEELAELIVAETGRISKLLDTMELFSSPEDLDLGPVNIHESMGEVIKVAKLSFGINIHFIEDYDPSLPKVWANEHVLHRVFLNLIKNACEACNDQNGQVRLKTRFHVTERRRIKGGDKAIELPIRVSFIDNGPGISSDVRDKLFDAFISTKEQGRGLGLPYVAGAIDTMQGDIDVRSAPGKTEFQLHLPQASVRGA